LVDILRLGTAYRPRHQLLLIVSRFGRDCRWRATLAAEETAPPLAGTYFSPADYRTDTMNDKLKEKHYREVIMRKLNSFPCLMGLLVAIAMFGMAGLALIGSATAQERPRVQKQANINQSFCIPHFGTTTVLARRSGRSVPIQTSTCISGSGNTTVVARPFGSENDRYECVGECRVVRMCLLQYCYNETVCNPCVRVVVVIGRD
jgi:hypothetical protein